MCYCLHLTHVVRHGKYLFASFKLRSYTIVLWSKVSIVCCQFWYYSDLTYYQNWQHTIQTREWKFTMSYTHYVRLRRQHIQVQRPLNIINIYYLYMFTVYYMIIIHKWVFILVIIKLTSNCNIYIVILLSKYTIAVIAFLNFEF
jgi:hypothetical protein